MKRNPPNPTKLRPPRPEPVQIPEGFKVTKLPPGRAFQMAKRQRQHDEPAPVIARGTVVEEMQKVFDRVCLQVFMAGIRHYPIETALEFVKLEFPDKGDVLKRPGLRRLLLKRYEEKYPGSNPICVSETEPRPAVR